MLITRETDYALRILYALSDGSRLTISEICRQELTPQQFGYKIMKKLAKGGLVEIIRGNAGGYRLVEDLKKVTLYDLLKIMGEDQNLSSCMAEDFHCPRRAANNNHCAMHENLAGIQKSLDRELKSHSLYDILTEQEDRT